jgi:hypothetical protein
MYKSIEKVVQEYVLTIDGLPFTIKGRISERLDYTDPSQRFSWAISHYFRPSENTGGHYRPSTRSASTLQNAEAMLKTYMDGITTFDVTPNEYY